MVQRIFLRDMNPSVCSAWGNVFHDAPNVFIQQGDIFQTRADAVVSPANSFGWMDGGIDGVYTQRMGLLVQERLQAQIRKLPFGELLIGQALIVLTGWETCPRLISAPTMRVPGPTTPEAVYLAARAAFAQAKSEAITDLAVPGMGTLTGRVAPDHAAAAMRAAYVEVFNTPAGSGSRR